MPEEEMFIVVVLKKIKMMFGRTVFAEGLQRRGKVGTDGNRCIQSVKYRK